MPEEINIKLINKLKQKPIEKDKDIFDTKIPGFVLRLRKSGKMFYTIGYWRDNRMHRMQIGPVDEIGIEFARERAKELIGKRYTGIDPLGACRENTLRADPTKLLGFPVLMI